LQLDNPVFPVQEWRYARPMWLTVAAWGAATDCLEGFIEAAKTLKAGRKRHAQQALRMRDAVLGNKRCHRGAESLTEERLIA
jgi:hypothetical protein